MEVADPGPGVIFPGDCLPHHLRDPAGQDICFRASVLHADLAHIYAGFANTNIHTNTNTHVHSHVCRLLMVAIQLTVRWAFPRPLSNGWYDPPPSPTTGPTLSRAACMHRVPQPVAAPSTTAMGF